MIDTGRSTAISLNEALPQPRICPDEVFGCAIPFWRSLYGEASGQLELSSGFRLGRRLLGITRISFSWPQQALEAAAWVTKEATYGRDVYQTPVLGSSNRLAIGSQTAFVVADLDEAPLEALPKPSIIIESSPGRRQCYWKLTEPVSTRVSFEMSRRIQMLAGGDAGVPSFLRVPGVLNRKYHDVWVSIAHRSERGYSPQHLAASIQMDADEIHDPVGRGVVEWIRSSPTLRTKTIRVAGACAAAALVLLGSLTLRAGEFDPSRLGLSAQSGDPRRLRVETVDPQLETLHLGSVPLVTGKKGGGIERVPIGPAKLDDSHPDRDGDEASPVGETSTEGVDTLRSLGQKIIDVTRQLG